MGRTVNSIVSRVIGVVALIIVIGNITSPSAYVQLPTTNLLVNPGAETGDLTGWTVGGVSNPGVDNGSFDPGINPLSGNFDFFGGSGISGTLTQNVSLVGNQGLTASMIDSGNLFANVSFFEQGLNQGTPSDDASIEITFRDGLNAALGGGTTAVVDSHDGNWQGLNTSFAIPVGTRSLDYTMLFTRNSGSDNDNFIDNNSLTVGAGGVAAPEPGSLSLVGMAVLPLLGILRRRKV